MISRTKLAAYFLLVGVAIVPAFSGGSIAHGQQPPEPTAATPESTDPPKPGADAAAEPPSGTATGREADLLSQLEAIKSQLSSAQDLGKTLDTQLADKRAELLAVKESGPAEEKPSFRLLDTLRDELANRQARSQTLQAATENAAAELASAKAQLLTKQQELRQLKQAPLPAGATEAAEQLREIKLAEIEVTMAGKSVELQQQEQANELKKVELHNRQVEIIEAKIVWIKDDVEFDAEALQDVMVDLDKLEADLKSNLRTAETNLQYAETQWVQARQKLDSTEEDPPERVEEVEARSLDRQLKQQRVSHVNAQLQHLGKRRELWRHRYQVLNQEAEPSELIEWNEEADQLQSQLQREKRLAQLRIDELRQELVIRDKRLQSTAADATAVKRWLTQQRQHLDQSIQLYNESLVDIDETLRLTEKLDSEIGGEVGAWSLSDWYAGAVHYATSVWNTELLTIEEQPLTVGKVLVGLVLLVCGFFVSRTVSRMLGRRLKQGRFQMNESGAAALQTVSFYLILVLCTLMALRIVNVPLTVFTFFGGAIAIGVGLGSQNVVNNFISGLVLLAERPIKVGDLIKIDGLYGNVTSIGARSTRIRTGDNMEIVVPNSTFLENNVVNLTRADHKIRTNIKVGVAYGSPTREVAKLLKHAADDHGQILKRPPPHVWFVDFADNSLNFELHFWLEVHTLMELRRVESDIRHRVDQLFREAGIVIAFPQRDVHLDLTTPVPVQMLPPAEEESSEETE